MKNISNPFKVLFVVMDFWQAGAERFAYEIDCALNKEKFKIHFLSVRDLNSSNDFTDYYYSKHIALGSEIHFLKNIITQYDSIKGIKNRFLIKLKKSTSEDQKIKYFFKQFDIVSWMGEYTLVHFFSHIDDSVYKKSIIHLMNAKFQNVPIYDHYSKKNHYTFTSGFDDADQVKHELSHFSNYKHVFFPLLLIINRKINNWQFNNATKKKIGIFTRLDAMKPLDPFFYAFHLLLDELPESELHIFGSGDAVQSGMHKYVRHLGILDKVFFRGHQEDIVQKAIDEKLDLVWFQGYKNRPAGYAGFDICKTGIPQIFWDFAHTEKHLENEGIPYPNYKNLNRFVSKSIELLRNEEAAIYLSNLQFNDLLQNRDIGKYISILENLFVEVAKKKQHAKVDTKYN